MAVVPILTKTRKKLREMRYYSADRRTTGWRRAFDLAPLFGLLLAIGIAWLSQVMISQEITLASQSGRLLDAVDGNVVAQFLKADNGAMLIGDDLAPGWKLRGRFELNLIEERLGWPARATIVLPPLDVDIDDYNIAGEDRQVRNADNPLVVAIREALSSDTKYAAMSAAIQRASPYRDGLVLPWLANIAFWWVGMTILVMIVLRVAKYAWSFIDARKDQTYRERLRSNKCPGCGYDLRGLEWNERCPECGALTA